MRGNIDFKSAGALTGRLGDLLVLRPPTSVGRRRSEDLKRCTWIKVRQGLLRTMVMVFLNKAPRGWAADVHGTHRVGMMLTLSLCRG